MILVFGRTGQVGTELAHGRGVRSLGREEADLTDPPKCAAEILKIKPNVVINAAAYTSVDRAEDEPRLAQLINAGAPAAMAAACAELGARFLHISTDYVFDGTGERPWQPDDPTGPLGVYGTTKLAGEVAIQRSGARYIILRTSWVFSPRGSNFVKTMLHLAATRNSVRVVADQIGAPTAAADIATCLLKIAAAEGPSGIYHFAGAPAVSWADFARAIFAEAGLSMDVHDIASGDYQTAARRPKNSRMDCSKIFSDYGIASPDWRTPLGKVVRGLQNPAKSK